MTLAFTRCLLLTIALGLLATGASGAEAEPPKPPAPKPEKPAEPEPPKPKEEAKPVLETKPIPRMQVVPLPYDQAAFERDGEEIARYHFGKALNRPFLYPILGPAGRPLTRMGHPHDPVGHGHHNSVWTSHRDVGGANFWENSDRARIVHQRILDYADAEDHAALTALNHWATKKGTVLIKERRTLTVRPLEARQWLLIVDLELAANVQPVLLGKTPFGVLAVRMAKTIGVHDGRGTIRNSEGGVDEKGVFWKQAKWVDYSGAVGHGILEGITLMDHPKNPNHPTHFHVRNDGWMGASLTFAGPRTLKPAEPLRLRYALYVHAGVPSLDALNAQWEAFAKLPLPKPKP